MLRDEAMIVRLSISRWTGRKFDKKVTQKVADDYGASSDVGRYNKILIAGDAIKAVTQAVSTARTFHYENTLIWDDFGGRLLPSANFVTYSKKMRELRSDFEGAVDVFIENYHEYREEARRRLNQMFNEDDYPYREEIKTKFAFAVDIEPVPDKDDFRIQVQSKDINRIKRELESSLKDRTAEAMKELFGRVHKAVGHLADKLSDTDAIFRDSLVDNVAELASLLPKLNVTNDPKLTKLIADMKKKLCVFEPKELREDAKVRGHAADQAKAILEKMKGYMG